MVGSGGGRVGLPADIHAIELPESVAVGWADAQQADVVTGLFLHGHLHVLESAGAGPEGELHV